MKNVIFLVLTASSAMGSELVLFESGILPQGVVQKIKSAKPTASPRARAKADYLAGNFEGCWKKLASAGTKQFGISAWIWRQKMMCATSLLAGDKIKRPQVFELIEGIGAFSAEMSRPPYQEALKSKWKELVLSNLELANFWPPNDRKRLAETALRWKHFFTSSEKSKLMRLMGESHLAKQNFAMARQWMERALLLEDSQETRQRIEVIDRISKNPGEDPQSFLGRSRKENDSSGDELPKEKEFYERALQTLKSGDVIAAADDLISILEVAPAGVRSRWATDKLQELYLQASEKEDPKFQMARSRLMSTLKKVDAMRLAKWVQVAFRVGQYADAYELGTEVLGRVEPMTAPTKTLWLTARSAQFLGKVNEARKLFGEVITTHAGTDEVQDGYLQLALIEIREGRQANAITLLEKILSKPRESGAELTARYWLWRALEKTDPARASTEARILSEKFPLSYYGLRARMESSGGALTSLAMNSDGTPLDPALAKEAKGKEGKQKAEIDKNIFSDGERESLDRAEGLLNDGWLEEAKFELSDIGDVRALSARLWLAQKFSQSADFLKASMIMNVIWDEDLSYANETHLKIVYPRFFLSGLEPEAKKYKLEPFLPLSLMRQESGFNIRAVSSSNAMGLMQMIPPTAKETARELNVKTLTLPDDMFDPRTNMKFCVYYLSKVILEMEGNVPAGLAAYNAGPSRLKKWLRARKLALVPSSDAKDEMWFDELPWDETRFYVKAILRNLVLYRYLDRGRVSMTQPLWNPQ